MNKRSHLRKEDLSFESNLRPLKIQVGEVMRVRIKNIGRYTESFAVTGRSRHVKFAPHAHLSTRLKAGESAILTFQPQPPTPPFFGNERHYSLRFQVQSTRGEAQILKGDLCTKSRISWQLVFLALVLFLSLFYFSGRLNGKTIFSHTNTVKEVKKVIRIQPTTETANPENPPAILPTKIAVIKILPIKPTLTPIPPHAGDVLYLTFDDGPSALWTQQILDILAKYHAKATFFILGIQAKEHPELIAAELEAGDQIAHHTWAHASLSGMSFNDFAREISQTNAVLAQPASPCLHLPYAEEDQYTEEYAKELGIEIVWWDIDTQDWSNPGQESIEKAVLSEVSPNDIILLHDGGGNRAQTVAALEKILSVLSQEGYVFETLCSN